MFTGKLFDGFQAIEPHQGREFRFMMKRAPEELKFFKSRNFFFLDTWNNPRYLKRVSYVSVFSWEV